MAKTKNVQVVDKNDGQKIQWEQSGEFLSFADGALALKVGAYQGDEERTVDILFDRQGNLVIGAESGIRYVAQVVIPAAVYEEHTEGEGEEAQTIREKLPIDMGDVVLVLWSIE